MTSNFDRYEDLISGSQWRVLLALLVGVVTGCSSSDDEHGNAAAAKQTGGSAGMGGAGMGDAGAGGSDAVSTMAEPTLPAPPDSCPELATGMVTVLGQQVQLWVGDKQTDKKGAVMFYWHGTGGNSAEAAALGPALNEITSEGGIVASFTTSLGPPGTPTGNNVWYVEDYKMADVILSCAIQQLNIDTRRIYSSGCSAGGLQSGSMAFSRSSYLAAAMTNSGGSIFISTFEDPSHVPSVITAHGGTADKVYVAFADTSKAEDKLIADSGGFAIDCNHGGGHCQAPTNLVAAQWQFLKDHPFGVSTDPYAAGLPPIFPTYCTKY